MKTTCRVAGLVTAVLLATVSTVGFAPAASAAYSPTPSGPAWTPDGPVHAVVTSPSRIFVGGSFTGGVAALDASSGALLWTASANGDVRALALSADGSQLLAGGTFTEVGGAGHKKLASLSVLDGSADPSWKASAGGTVRDMVVDGDTLYFGGAFTKHSGILQGGLGAVRVSTGKVVPDFDTSTDARVYGLAKTGSKLVLAGDFTRVNGQPRNSLASVDLAGYTLNGWNPARVCIDCNVYWDIAIDQNTVFVVSRNRGALSALDLTTGLRRWRTLGANGDAQAVAVSDGLVYVGGHFGAIAGQPRKILAAVNETSGAVDPAFTPNFVTAYPGIWALAATTSDLYVGGAFTAAGPTPPKRFPYLAMFASAY